MVCFLFSFSFNDVYALNGMSRPNVKALSVTYNRVKIYWNNVKSAKGYAVYKHNSKSKNYMYLTSASRIMYIILVVVQLSFIVVLFLILCYKRDRKVDRYEK